MRQTTVLVPLLAAILATGLCGCGKDSKNTLRHAGQSKDPQPDTVVAIVDGTSLTWADMNKRAMGYMKDDIETNHLMVPSNRLDEAKEFFRRKSVNAFVFKTVMMDAAAKENLKVTLSDRQDGYRSLALSLKSRNWTTNDFFNKGPLGPETMRREFEDGLLIDKLLKNHVRDNIKITDKEIADTITTLTATNEMKRAELENVRKQLLKGADFADVARTVSECPSGKNGGDLGEFGRGKMLKEFEDAAFSQEVGAIGPIIQTRFGYHILKVTAHTPAKAATKSTPAVPETVRASHILIKTIPIERKRITDSILRAKYNAGVEAYYRELKSKAKIECLLYKDMKF